MPTKNASRKCRCGLKLRPDGTCLYGCPAKNQRRPGMRRTEGVKPKHEQYLSAEESRAGIRNVIKDWDREAAQMSAASRQRWKNRHRS